MGDDVNDVRAVVVDPQRLIGGDSDTRARGVLYRDGVSAAVADDENLVQRRDDKVAGTARSAGKVQTQVARGLACVDVRERERHVPTRERNRGRPDSGFFERSAEVYVGRSAPRRGVLASRHQLKFQVGAVRAGHVSCPTC